ncbi:MAG: glycosyltransferase [Deltaproteobacteria bacterium]|nr:glycosyltransferase [Deltaproteobacteria bacterium]
MKPRILLVLPLTGGSLIVGMHVADALMQMEDIDSEIFQTQPLYDLYTRSFRHLSNETATGRTILAHINLAAMGKVVDFKPDLVLVMALAPITPWFIERVKELGAIIAHWYIENFRYFPQNPIVPKWQTIVPYYNYFFTVQKGDFLEGLKSKGVNSHYLPTACNPRLHNIIKDTSPFSSKYFSDICFVGSPYPNRIELFEHLTEFNISLWGPGWSEFAELRSSAQGDGTLINYDEESKILNGSKIGLNIHSTLYQGTMIERCDFLNPRVFTIAACGIAQLVDDQDLIKEVFELEKDIITYNNVETLKSQLRYLLNNNEVRESLARSAYIKVMEEHTYDHRIREMMHIVNLT